MTKDIPVARCLQDQGPLALWALGSTEYQSVGSLTLWVEPELPDGRSQRHP